MDDNVYNKINDWLEGNMSVEDKRAFEAEMEKNPDLAHEAKLAKDAMAAINEKDVIAFREQVSGIMSEEIPSIKKNNKTWNIVLAVFGLLILSLLVFLFFNKKQKENKETSTQSQPVALFDKHFAPPRKLISLKDTQRGIDVDSLKKNIDLLVGELNEHFQDKDYNGAFIILDNLMKMDTGNILIQEKDINFSKGLLYLLTDQPQLAVDAFELANENLVWDDVQWYLAGAYIKLKKFSEAEIILNKLNNGNNPVYKNRAGQVLLDLNK